ncbi:hypothetical protein AAG570_013496 [Ranatra chinensis]|uniref:Noggin n=1 Tax=Ranatra chinensis TaxID=642074 RepID=A0ABD0YR37_9HEMI
MVAGVTGGGGAVNGGLGLSPEAQGLRPSGGLPPPPELVEAADPGRDPRPQDINATLLARILGHHLDPKYMSQTPPLPEDNLAKKMYRRNKKGRLVPVGVMPQHLKELDLKWVRLGDGTKLRTRVPARLRRKLQQLLWAVTACPVGHSWRDLGPRFWPRWLREGTCLQEGDRPSSCSVPPGMRCRPSATAHRTLLRWHCKQQNQCHWIKIQYPVVTQCSCLCPENNS